MEPVRQRRGGSVPPYMQAFPVSPSQMHQAPPPFHYRQAQPSAVRMPATHVIGGPIPVSVSMYSATMGGAQTQTTIPLPFHGDKVPSPQNALVMKQMFPQQPIGFNPQMKRPSGGQNVIPNLVHSPGLNAQPANVDFPSSQQLSSRVNSNANVSSPGSLRQMTTKPTTPQASDNLSSRASRPQPPVDSVIYAQQQDMSSETRKRSFSASPMVPRNQSVLGSSSAAEPQVQTNPYAGVSQTPQGLSPAYMEKLVAQSSNGTRTDAIESGVGLYFKMDSNTRYYVDYITPDSSAAATGVIQPGDVLENVDGQVVAGKNWNQLRRMIVGERGTFVNLSFLRELQDEAFRFDLDLVRGDPVPVENISQAKSPSPEMKQDMMHGIHVPTFTPENVSDISYPQVDKEKENLKKKYLAEQRLHLEAEEELKQCKRQEQVSMLRLTIADLQNEKAQAATMQGVEENALAVCSWICLPRCLQRDRISIAYLGSRIESRAI
eukprot:768694-Hanusia_phi.AAC.8